MSADRPMNVAVVMERIEPWRGGAETSTMLFAQHLARLGCRVSVLTTTHAPSTRELTVVPIKAPGTLRASRTLLFARRAAEYLREHPFDIAHSITPCLAADVYQPRGGTVPEMLARNLAMRPAALRRGFKRLGQRLNPKYRVVAGLERRLLTRQPPPRVIAISNYVAEQLARHYQFDPDRVRLIFNGVDPDPASPGERREHRRQIRKQFGLAEDDLLVLCVANNFKLKGVGKLIEALARLRWPARVARARPAGGTKGVETRPAAQRTEIYAVIVGRDKLAPFVKLAERLRVADRVLFSGPTQRVQAFFHAADFLVHPTFYDPCSRVVLEALAAGLPVITTRFNGAAERISDGREGYVIERPEDVDALAERMLRLADPRHRQACSRQAAAAVAGFSIARHAAEVLKLYREIIASGELRHAEYRMHPDGA